MGKVEGVFSFAVPSHTPLVLTFYCNLFTTLFFLHSHSIPLQTRPKLSYPVGPPVCLVTVWERQCHRQCLYAHAKAGAG